MPWIALINLDNSRNGGIILKHRPSNGHSSLMGQLFKRIDSGGDISTGYVCGSSAIYK
jgi:hypothetical protein